VKKPDVLLMRQVFVDGQEHVEFFRGELQELARRRNAPIRVA
jgi:hypothetical protein